MKSGEWVLLAQLTEKPMKDLIVPNVPTIQKIARSDEQRLLLKYGTSTPNDFGKVYVLPPGVPADRAQAIETAFARVFNDKDLRADADKGQLGDRPADRQFDPKARHRVFRHAGRREEQASDRAQDAGKKITSSDLC